VAAVRLAGLLAGLSRFADLGFGLEPGSALRSAVLAGRLARHLDLPEADVRAAFYTALLHHVGCVGYAHETARLFGDDLVANAAAARVDAGSPRDVLATFVPRLTSGMPARRRVGLAVTAVTHGGRWGRELTATACDVGRDCARRLDLPVDVQTSLQHVFDLWRGHGREHRVAGDDLPLGARIARLAGIAVLFASIGGPGLAVDAVRRRSGGMLDPALVTPFAAGVAGWLQELDQGDPRLLALDAEPTPWVTTSDIPAVAEVFGDLADLKSPFLLGHSRHVSRACGRAARRLGLTEQECEDVATAGSLHDLGRVAVSSAVWDKPGPLDDDEWE
jgi:hypothetical protein